MDFKSLAGKFDFEAASYPLPFISNLAPRVSN